MTTGMILISDNVWDTDLGNLWYRKDVSDFQYAMVCLCTSALLLTLPAHIDAGDTV